MITSDSSVPRLLEYSSSYKNIPLTKPAMADYTSLPAGTPVVTAGTTRYVAAPQTQTYAIQTESRGPSGVAWAALVIALILLIILIIFAIFYFRNRNTDNGNPFWLIVLGSGTGDETFAPDGNDIYIAAKRTTSFNLRVNASGTALTGRMFMVDNTINDPAVILTVVPGTGVTIVDNVGVPPGTIPGRTTAQYLWLSNTSITRLF